MRKIIYFLRHGETEYNRQGIIQGSGIDSDLNDTGIEQRGQFYKTYKNIGFELVITSDLKRTQQTVQPFIDKGITWETHGSINEISWGVHEGKKGSPEMAEKYKTINAAWNNGDYDARIEGGESAAELGARLHLFLEVLKKKKEQKILVCTHGRTMSAMTCLLDSRPLKDMYLFKNHNTALTKAVLENNHFVLAEKGNRNHLTK